MQQYDIVYNCFMHRSIEQADYTDTGQQKHRDTPDTRLRFHLLRDTYTSTCGDTHALSLDVVTRADTHWYMEVFRVGTLCEAVWIWSRQFRDVSFLENVMIWSRRTSSRVGQFRVIYNEIRPTITDFFGAIIFSDYVCSFETPEKLHEK